MILAFTGKGGVGKTTLSALAVTWLAARGEGPVLAVDADSNANLHEALGVSYESTVGGIREHARKAEGISKHDFLELRVQQALVEHNGFDLIVMGRPEGQGCYCFANSVLRDVLNRVARNYRHIVIDSEAGLEHISRRTLLALDQLLIVSDCTVRGLHTAARISALADEVGLGARNRWLVVNRVPEGALPPSIRRAADATSLTLLAAIPLDARVADLDAGGEPVAGLPAGAPARRALDTVMERLLA